MEISVLSNFNFIQILSMNYIQKCNRMTILVLRELNLTKANKWMQSEIKTNGHTTLASVLNRVTFRFKSSSASELSQTARFAKLWIWMTVSINSGQPAGAGTNKPFHITAKSGGGACVVCQLLIAVSRYNPGVTNQPWKWNWVNIWITTPLMAAH